MNKNFVDIHCHYFNGKFAFRELLEIGWRKLNGNYPAPIIPPIETCTTTLVTATIHTIEMKKRWYWNSSRFPPNWKRWLNMLPHFFLHSDEVPKRTTSTNRIVLSRAR